jgi:hypothetical protein
MTQSISPLLSKWPSVPASDFMNVQKSEKISSLGRKNFFPGQGEKIIENILKIFVKIFGGMKNIY